MGLQLARPRPCPVCDRIVTQRFLRLRQVPVNCSALYHSAERALGAPRGDIELAACESCGMIFNAIFDPNQLKYDTDYDNSLSYSPVFQAYANELAERLVNTYDLRSKSITEIGCGRGYFINRLCELGANRGMGFDPAADPAQSTSTVTLVPALFASEHVSAADFVCCRHVLEHIPQPQQFLRLVRKSIADRRGFAYFEVPNAECVLNGVTTWDLIYPHCSYFTAPSLRRLFDGCGFETVRIEPTFGGQFLGIEVRASSGRRNIASEAKSVALVSRWVHRFDLRLRQSIFRWSRFIEYASVEGRGIVMWGAGAKGVTFLNVVPGSARVQAVVDVNPRKQGTFIPGTAQPVIAPRDLGAYTPDVVLVLNPNYTTEIRRSVAELSLSPHIAVTADLPLPQNRFRAAAV